jgi:DNA polymerase-3 subunit delta'
MAGPAAPADAGAEATFGPELPWIPEAAAAIASRQRGHAMLLQGRAGDGVFELAVRLARAALCEAPDPATHPCGVCAACHLMRAHSHPDLRVLLPEAVQLAIGWGAADDGDAEEGGKGKRKPSKEIRIDAVRAAIDWTQTTSGRGLGKVLLLFPADAMNLVSANALLKTLEEPPAGVRILLVTEDAERLLPTLRSRCQRVVFAGPTPAQARDWLAAQGLPEAGVLLAAAGGQPLVARSLATEGLDGAAWRALPKAVAEGRWQPPAAMPLPRLREVLQKVCHDAMAVAAGATPRYFPAESLPPAPPWQRLADWSGALARLARNDEHPFNAPLMTESLLAEARAVWGRAGRPGGR